MYVSTVSFQHGELIPEEAHKLNCGLYSHRKTGERVVRVAADSHSVFSGSVPAAGNQLSCDLIAIRNRRTNKVRFHPFLQFATSCVLIIYILLFMKLGHAVAQWLRHSAMNRKVAGLIPDGVTGIFH
jgi:hypothetical protein